MRTIFRIPTLLLLLMIGAIDLVATALLHAQGLIVEANPIMRPFIEHSEWTFAVAKGSTLVVAAWFFARLGQEQPGLVSRVCGWASLGYVAVWAAVFSRGI